LFLGFGLWSLKEAIFEEGWWFTILHINLITHFNEHQLPSKYSFVMNSFDGQGIRGIGWSWSSVGWFFIFIWFLMLSQFLSSWQHPCIVIRTKIGRLKMELQKIAIR
jgi:hypothetical protein